MAHDAAGGCRRGGHRASNGQVMHLAVGTQSADQALIVRRAVDVQVPHREARTVQFAGKALAGVADGRPGEARQFNVSGQLSLDIVGSGVYRLGKPCQFRAGADLVNIVLKLRLGDGRTVPCALHYLFQHNGNGQDAVLYLCRAAGTQREAAGAVDIALCLHIVTVGIIGRILVQPIHRGKIRTIGVRQGNGRVFNGLAILIHNVHANIIALLLHGDGDIHQVAGQRPQQQRREVGGHTQVGHGVHEVKGIGSGVHIAGNMAVGQHIVHGVGAVLKGEGTGDGELQHGGVHPLVLIGTRQYQIALRRSIGNIQILRIKRTSHLIDAAIQAVEGHTHRIAGSEGIAGVGDILQRRRDLGHPHQPVADAGVVGHLDNNGAALAVAQAVEGGQRNGIAAVGAGSGGVLGHGGLHSLIGRHKGIFHSYLAGTADREVQGGVGVLCAIEPCIKAVVPLVRTGAAVALDGVIAHVRFSSTVPGVRTGHHRHGHALGAGGGEQAAGSGVILRIHVDTVIPCGDHRILCAGRHIRPVVAGIAAVDSGKGNVAGDHIPVEVRLDNNIGRIAADQFPEAVSPQAGRTVQHLVAGGIQTYLNVRLITGSRACAQTAAVMGDTLGIIGVKAIVKGQRNAVGLFLDIALLVEAGTGHMGRITKTPCVEIGTRHTVLRLPLDLIGGGLGAVAVVLPIDDRLYHSGVEVVHLAIEVKGGA